METMEPNQLKITPPAPRDMAAVRFAWQIVPPASSATAGKTFPLKIEKACQV
jgi:hypothetical protein